MSDQNRDKLRELTDRQQAREKLPVFYGSRDNFQHGFKEVLGNAVDEINNNFSKGIITVKLSDDLRTISVSDSGRGMPLTGETDGKHNSELLFETLFAGSNYDNAQNGKIAVGTNGIGVTVLNYTSEYFKAVAFREGQRNGIEYTDGGNNKEWLESKPCKESTHGTVITFTLDPNVYTKVTYNPKDIEEIIKKTAATANKIKFKFKHNEETKEFSYESLKDYFEQVSENLTCKPVVGTEFTDNREDEMNTVEMMFATASEPIHESFLNINWLPEHGTIHDGVIAGIRNFVNKIAKDKKLIDKKSNIGTNDVEDSVSYVVSVLSTNVEYANQTKLSTDKKLYRAIVMDYTKQLLEAFQAEQPKEFDKLVKHIVQVNKFNNRNNAAKQKLKKQLNEKVDSLSNRVDKLVESDKTGFDAELYIAEGDSANGSVVLARDGETQAAYPLRGKILNCMKADYLKMFNNKVVMDLIKVIGTGVTADKKHKDLHSFDLKNSNYGKFIITTDADADGQQIACLIITFFYRLMRPIIEEGMLYIAKTPLYKVKLEDDSTIYYFSENEKDKELPKVKGKYTIARCKGLGELDADTMAYTAMEPETRILHRVAVEDAEDMVKAVDTFMGTDITERKKYIEENLHAYIQDAAE